MGQALLPVGGDQLALLVEGVHVVGEGQGDDVGLEAVDHRAGLLAGAAVGLLDGDHLVVAVLPVFGEGGVVVLVELAGRVIGDVEQGHVGKGLAGEAEGQDGGEQAAGKAGRGGLGAHGFFLGSSGWGESRDIARHHEPRKMTKLIGNREKAAQPGVSSLRPGGLPL